jgi:hypothetical protein
MNKLPKEFDQAVTIIPQDVCAAAVNQARREFRAWYPDPRRLCVMPILRGGRVFGEALGYPTNPIRMSYYRGGERLPHPICLVKPDMTQMVGPDGKTLPVVMVEGVIETSATIRSTVTLIEQLCREHGLESPPYYEAQALVIKTDAPDNIPDRLPNPPCGIPVRFVAQLWVHVGIWIHGMGVDDSELGRDLPEFRGRLSPFAEREPDAPYYRILNPRLAAI